MPKASDQGRAVKASLSRAPRESIGAAECVKLHPLRGRLSRRVALERTADRSLRSVATFDTKTGRETNRWIVGSEIVLCEDEGAGPDDSFCLLEPSTQQRMFFVRQDGEGVDDFAALIDAIRGAQVTNAEHRAVKRNEEWVQPDKIEGYLYKKGSVAKTLKRRWFVCEKGSKKLAYFSRKLRVKKGEIDLSTVQTLVEGFQGQFCILTEESSGGDRTWDLHIEVPKKARAEHFTTSADWLRFLSAEADVVVKGNSEFF